MRVQLSPTPLQTNFEFLMHADDKKINNSGLNPTIMTLFLLQRKEHAHCNCMILLNSMLKIFF